VIARWIATCGGLGYAPVVPGTVASLPVALLAWLLAPGGPWLAAAALVVSAAGIWAAGREEARLGVHDPGSIVVDEAAGMLVALVGHPASLSWVLALFLLFRVMDVWKPFPIHRLQSLPGGWGVVCDDLLAGLYANLLLQVPRWF
jgi:phosphatidylglycerophosphatase A